MNDVMTSLQDMSSLHQSSPPARAESPPGVWSPDAYDLVRKKSMQDHRAQSAMGFAQHERAQSSLGFANHYQPYEDVRSKTPAQPSSRQGKGGIDDYVQRMEKQLRHAPSFSSENPPQPPLKGAQYGASHVSYLSINISIVWSRNMAGDSTFERFWTLSKSWDQMGNIRASFSRLWG